MSARHSDWLMERIAAGDVPGDGTAEERAQLDALAESNAAILEELPVAAVAAEIERRLHVARAAAAHERRSRRRAWIGIGAVAAAAAVLAMFVLMRDDDSPRQVAEYDPAQLDGGVRIKGDARLVLHRKSGEAVTELRAGGMVTEGDRLQISYVSAGKPHGVILSIDGRGAVTLHYPSEPDQSTVLGKGKAIPLRHSYRLDDAPDYERFFFITSSQPMDPRQLVHIAERWAAQPRRARNKPLPLAKGLEQTTVLLRKAESK